MKFKSGKDEFKRKNILYADNDDDDNKWICLKIKEEKTTNSRNEKESNVNQNFVFFSSFFSVLYLSEVSKQYVLCIYEKEREKKTNNKLLKRNK